jgi:hypothetical protein
MSLLYIGEQLTIYGGFFFLITGIIGNVMNIFKFSSVRTYRRTPSTFYFLVSSIDNLVYIMINLISRIFSTFNSYFINLVQDMKSFHSYS